MGRRLGPEGPLQTHGELNFSLVVPGLPLLYTRRVLVSQLLKLKNVFEGSTRIW